MIDAVIVIKVAAGKTGSHAIKWANKAIAYEKKKGSQKLTLYRPMTGDMNEIAFVSRWPSMAEYEEHYRKQRDDPEFMAIGKEMLESD